MNLSMTLPV